MSPPKAQRRPDANRTADVARGRPTVQRATDSARGAAPVLIARAHIVTSCRGRERLVLVVRCHLCAGKHEHVAPLDFAEGVRSAGCGRGRYVVRAAVVEEGRVA